MQVLRTYPAIRPPTPYAPHGERSVARGYAMQAQYRKLLQDAADSQTANGLIPTTAPEDSLFAGAFRHDANWGATLAVSSWQLYHWYGDASAMAEASMTPRFLAKVCITCSASLSLSRPLSTKTQVS